MTVRVGINGFGRIGRNFFRAAKLSGADIDFVAVNDLGSTAMMAHLLQYDSVHGKFGNDIRVAKNGISVDGDTLLVLSERNPEDLPWGELGVDVVIESTGIFTKKAAASMHRKAGAPKVIISAPSGDSDATFVIGVNDQDYNPDRHHIISNASCTTNSFAPMIKVLDEAFGVVQGLMTTVHGYTGDQALVDGPHSDPRRARAAAINIIPTSTGAASATGLVIKKMKGRLDGRALRVPIPDGSITDFTGVLKKNVTEAQVNDAFKKAARSGQLKNVLEYSEAPLVSSDIVGSPASCTFDSGLTMAQGNLVKVFGWYDNEMGYSNRLVDLSMIVGTRKKKVASKSRSSAAAKRSISSGGKVAAKNARKAPAKKAAAKKSTARKSTARKSAAKKAPTRVGATARRSARK